MVINHRPLLHVCLFIPMCLASQELPRRELNFISVSRIVSVDNKIEIESKKWRGFKNQAELGIIASPVGGWENRLHIYGFDCTVAFQTIDQKNLNKLGYLHEWLKFPYWSHIKTTHQKIGRWNTIIISRVGFSHENSDQIFLAGGGGDRLIIVRLIALGKSKAIDRFKVVEEFLDLIANRELIGQYGRPNVDDKAMTIFKDSRDVPGTLEGAVKQFVGDLTPLERNFLVNHIKDEPDLLDKWPTIDDKVSRLFWIMIYWGLNDPDSPLRKNIKLPNNLDNASYIIELLKSAEKLISKTSNPQ